MLRWSLCYHGDSDIWATENLTIIGQGSLNIYKLSQVKLWHLSLENGYIYKIPKDKIVSITLKLIMGKPAYCIVFVNFDRI